MRAVWRLEMAANCAIERLGSDANPVPEDELSTRPSTAATHTLEDVLIGIAIAVCALDKRVPQNLAFDIARMLLEARTDGRARELLESSFHEASSLPDWLCAACGEGNPATFELCWNCLTPCTLTTPRLSERSESRISDRIGCDFRDRSKSLRPFGGSIRLRLNTVNYGTLESMNTTSQVTADELLALPTGMGKRYELIAGELRVMSPAGWEHGKIVHNVETVLGYFIRQNCLGRGFGAETGFLLKRDPDTVRAPDFAFIADKNLPKMDPKEAFWPGAPDLAVEVLSTGDSSGEVADKIDEWLAAGCGAVWVIDPKLQTVTIYQSAKNVQIKTAGEMLSGEPVVPGFSSAVDEFFR
jgi:Uma2 family endonuclease